MHDTIYERTGYHNVSPFIQSLKPKQLSEALTEYQKCLGKDFGINELLKIKEIESKLMFSSAIGDFSEQFWDELCKYRQSSVYSTVSSSLNELACAVRDYFTFSSEE